MRFVQNVLVPLASFSLLTACGDESRLSDSNNFSQSAVESERHTVTYVTQSIANSFSSYSQHTSRDSETKIKVSPAALKVGLHDEYSDYSVSLDALTSTLVVGSTRYAKHNVNVASESELYRDSRSAEKSDALKVQTSPFDATIDKANNTLHLQNDFEFSLEVNNEEGQFASDIFRYAENPNDERLMGTIVIEIPADTKMIVKKLEEGDAYTEVTKIESGGPMMIRGTHFFAFDQSITMGECFIWEDDYLEFGSGFERVVCP